jgi:hypothetical protein
MRIKELRARDVQQGREALMQDDSFGYREAQHAPSRFPLLRSCLVQRKRTHRKQSLVVLALWVMVVLVMGVALRQQALSLRALKGFLAVGLGIVGSVMYIAWAHIHDPMKNRVLCRIERGQPPVVWIYRDIVKQQHRLCVGFADKKLYRLGLDGNSDWEALLLEVNAAHPHATLGYSTERHRLCMTEPRKLLRGPAEGA